MSEKRPSSQSREKHEPDELQTPVSPPLLALFIGIIAWGGAYYFNDIGFPSDAGDRRSAIVLNSNVKIDGAAAFAGNCSACHQATGLGVEGAFPPLVGSEWVVADAKIPVQILLNGLEGEVTVKGVKYEGAMPNFGETLDDATLSAILTYVRSNWGNTASPVGPEVFANERKRKRSEPWSEKALKSEVGSP